MLETLDVGMSMHAPCHTRRRVSNTTVKFGCKILLPLIKWAPRSEDCYTVTFPSVMHSLSTSTELHTKVQTSISQGHNTLFIQKMIQNDLQNDLYNLFFTRAVIVTLPLLHLLTLAASLTSSVNNRLLMVKLLLKSRQKRINIVVMQSTQHC